MINLNFIYSELFLALSIMTLLIVVVFKMNSSFLVYNLSIISLLICLALIFNFPINENVELFKNSYKIDYLSSFSKILFLQAYLFYFYQISMFK